MHPLSRKAFTLIELLVVIAIIAVLAVVVVLTLNPAALLQQLRDSNRVSDMATLNSAINLYNTDQSGASSYSLGSSNTAYVSIPDPTATSSAGDQCQGLGLISLPSTYTYHCAASSTYRNLNGTGWIPVNFSNISSGSPLGSLPVDPTNSSSSRLYYTYDTNGNQFEITVVMESAKYQLGGSNDVISTDGGTLASVYEKGSKLGLEPLDYGDDTLVGWWPLSEGTGTVAYDDSGNGNNGSWSGTAAGTNSTYYSSGKVGSYSGMFDGSTNYVNIGNPVSLQEETELTIGAWANPVNYSNSPFVVGKQNTYTYSAGYSLFFNTSGTIAFDVYSSAGHQTVTSALPLTANSWNYIVGVLDSSNNAMKIYVNGVAQGTITTSGSFSPETNTPFSVGSRYYNSGWTNLFRGLIDDVRVYKRALTAAQIAAIYNRGK
jgi:prepilin-type N-terminal cleavage/methylation domain-containing protein